MIFYRVTPSKTLFSALFAATLAFIAALSACGGTYTAPPVPLTYVASASPATLAFATQLTGSTSASQAVTLTNTGTGTLTITGIAVTGPFAETNNCGSTLGVTASCQVQVTFTPTASGASTGSLTISDNATAGSQTVGLSGTAVDPTFTATATPGSLTFASQIIGTASTAQTVTLTNTGTGTLSITGIAVTGALASFSETSTCGATLNAGASCQLAVTFNPTLDGADSGVLTISDNAAAGPQTVTLNGTGILGAVTVMVHPSLAAVAASWQTQTFTAIITGDPNQNVTWSVDGTAGGDASSGTIASDGTYTPPAAGGTHTITAISTADVTKSATASVAVTDLPGVFTYHSNVARDGVNAQEYALTSTSVAQSSFGKLFSCTADGVVYAQPLWVPGLTIGGGQHNVLFVATQHGSLYAFDADANPCNQLWQANLLDTAHGATAGELPVGTFDVGFGYQDVQPEVCVTGTPVIDSATGTLYLVTKSKDTAKAFHQRLHAIDLFTGNEKFSGPVAISASVAGSGDGSSGGVLNFSTQNQHQRAGLALVNGMVYISWASHEDKDPYHGWVIAYDAATLTQQATFNTSPDGKRSGVWMAGGAPAADNAGNLFLTTGNGTFDANAGSAPNMDLGDSVLHLTPSLAVMDSFTPFNQNDLNNADQDVSSSGLLLLPDETSGLTHLLISGGKEGRIYLLNRDNMGLFCSGCSTDTNAVQSIFVGGEDFGTPAFWQNHLYYASSGMPLQLYSFDPVQSLLSSAAVSQTSETFEFPGPVPAISSSGDSNGILWGLEVSAYGVPSDLGSGPAVLHAYDATNVATELWNSSQAAGNRDTAGAAVKFTVPTVANGKVYVGTRTEVDVYGLLPN